MPLPMAITLGDPAGAGPGLLDRALASFPDAAPARVYGPAPLVADLATRHAGLTPIATTPDVEGIVTGRYTPASGAASIAALAAATRDLAAGAVAALVTGPIHKLALAQAGLSHPGQTEYVAEAMGVRRFAMMLAGPRLRVTLATTHLALRDVPSALTADAVFDAADLTAAFLRDQVGLAAPRIAVLGLNPHAGDEGRFGDEEPRIIAPAVDRLRAAGIDARGPLPADTAFHRAVQGEFDAVVAMYHDQGLGPLKLLHFADGINVTLGLPRPRCSPDHGPAYDRALDGSADPASFRAALAFAAACRP